MGNKNSNSKTVDKSKQKDLSKKGEKKERTKEELSISPFERNMESIELFHLLVKESKEYREKIVEERKMIFSDCRFFSENISLESIPDEIVVEILKYFTPEEVFLVFSLISKRFLRISKSSFMIKELIEQIDGKTTETTTNEDLWKEFEEIRSNDYWSRKHNFNTQFASLKYIKETSELKYIGNNNDQNERFHDWIIKDTCSNNEENNRPNYGICLGTRVYFRGRKRFCFFVEDDTSYIRDFGGPSQMSLYIGFIDPRIFSHKGEDSTSILMSSFNFSSKSGFYGGYLSSFDYQEKMDKKKNMFVHFNNPGKMIKSVKQYENEEKTGIRFEWDFEMDFDNGKFMFGDGKAVIFSNLVTPLSLCLLTYETCVKCAIRNTKNTKK